MSSEAESRELSLHERFSITRRNFGCAPILVVVVAYPNATALPTHSFLVQRVAEMQEHFPALYARIQGQRTTTPRAVLNDQPWTADDVLSQGEYVVSPSKGERGREAEYISLVDQETERIAQRDLATQPSWHVRLHTLNSHDQAQTASRVYLTLSIDHVFADGRALIALLEALLAEDISSLPYDKLSSITKAEDTIPMKPSLGYILPVIFQKLFVPILPVFLQKYLRAPAPWPGKNIRASPIDCPPTFSVLSLNAEEVAALKLASKSHGIKALHAVFQALFVTAIWSKFRYTTEGKFIVSTATPRSERKSELGHPYCTGNYISSQKVHLDFTTDEEFWTLAKKISDDLANPRAIKYAREGMGSLSYVPDGVHDPDDPLRPTKWEEFFLKEAKSDEPFNESISLSNLGMYKLPAGAEDLIWGQQSTPLSQPFNICALGHEAGVRFMVGWRDGSAVVKEDVDEMDKVFRQVMTRLIGSQKDTTLQALTQT